MSKDKGTSTTDITRTKGSTSGSKKDKSEYFILENGDRDYKRYADGSYKHGHSPNSKGTQFTSESGKAAQLKAAEARKNNTSLRDSFIAKGGLLPEEFLYGIMNDENASPSVRMKAAEKLIDFTQPKLSSVQQKTEVSQTPAFTVNVKKKLSPEDAKKISKVIDKETDEDTSKSLDEDGEEPGEK